MIKQRDEERGGELGYNGILLHFIPLYPSSKPTNCTRKMCQVILTISRLERKNIFKLLYHPLETVKSISQEQFEKVCQEYPCFRKIHSTIWEFKDILAGKNVDVLDKWIEKAKKLDIPEIDSFIYGLKRDWDAVRNAIKYEYSNGLVEGSINKLKVIKRIMYGRCSFDTLRTKTLRLEKMRSFN